VEKGQRKSDNWGMASNTYTWGALGPLQRRKMKNRGLPITCGGLKKKGLCAVYTQANRRGKGGQLENIYQLTKGRKNHVMGGGKSVGAMR